MAGDLNVIGPRSGNDEALLIFRALREDRIDAAQRVAKEPVPAAIARQSAVGDAAVHQNQRSSGSLRFPIKVGPDLGLKHDHRSRPQTPKYAPDHGPVIERREKYAVGK